MAYLLFRSQPVNALNIRKIKFKNRAIYLRAWTLADLAEDNRVELDILSQQDIQELEKAFLNFFILSWLKFYFTSPSKMKLLIKN